MLLENQVKLSMSDKIDEEGLSSLLNQLTIEKVPDISYFFKHDVASVHTASIDSTSVGIKIINTNIDSTITDGSNTSDAGAVGVNGIGNLVGDDNVNGDNVDNDNIGGGVDCDNIIIKKEEKDEDDEKDEKGESIVDYEKFMAYVKKFIELQNTNHERMEQFRSEMLSNLKQLKILDSIMMSSTLEINNSGMSESAAMKILNTKQQKGPRSGYARINIEGQQILQL